MPPVPARERGRREVLRGMRHAAGPGVHQGRSATVSGREVLSGVCTPDRAIRRAAPGSAIQHPCVLTPRHLAEILTSKAVLEGERKQVTVLPVDLKGVDGASSGCRTP